MVFLWCLLTVEMINAATMALERPDFRVAECLAKNLRLFPSLPDGLPATESIKSDAEAPVLHLIYDRSDCSNLPPLVFYDLSGS